MCDIPLVVFSCFHVCCDVVSGKFWGRCVAGATPQQEKSSSQGEGAAENQAQQASAAPKFGGGFGKKAATAGAGEGSQASSASSKPSFGSSFGKKAASAGATSGNAEEAKSAGVSMRVSTPFPLTPSLLSFHLGKCMQAHRGTVAFLFTYVRIRKLVHL